MRYNLVASSVTTGLVASSTLVASASTLVASTTLAAVAAASSLVVAASATLLATAVPTTSALVSTTSTTTVTSSTSTSALGTSIGKVDFDAPAIKLLLVEVLDGSLGFGLRAEGHESEATGAAGVAVPHDDRVKDLAEFRESITEGIIGRVPAQIATCDDRMGSVLEIRVSP